MDSFFWKTELGEENRLRAVLKAAPVRTLNPRRTKVAE